MNKEKSIVIALLLIVAVLLVVIFVGMFDSDDGYYGNGRGMGWGMHGGHMMVNSEEEFIAQMIPHHQEAVDTAGLINSQTKNEELRILTSNIVKTQTEEIKMLQSWKDDWYGNSDYVALYVPMMPDLEKLSIEDADEAFLQGMIMHHQMAVMMAQQVLALNPHTEVADFARSVIEVQSREIVEMREMLKDY